MAQPATTTDVMEVTEHDLEGQERHKDVDTEMYISSSESTAATVTAEPHPDLAAAEASEYDEEEEEEDPFDELIAPWCKPEARKNTMWEIELLTVTERRDQRKQAQYLHHLNYGLWIGWASRRHQEIVWGPEPDVPEPPPKLEMWIYRMPYMELVEEDPSRMFFKGPPL